jgi:hypothetical protein
VSLKDKVVRALALRWVRGKVERARKEGNAVMKLLDGNKRLIFVLVWLVGAVVQLFTGHDFSQIIGLVGGAIGWADPATLKLAQEAATFWAPLIFGLIAAGHATWKGWTQWKAGARVLEINSLEGYVKLAESRARAQGLYGGSAGR